MGDEATCLLHMNTLTLGRGLNVIHVQLQVMGLEDHQLRWLVNHMGHTEKVHLQHYRATSGLIERLDIAKIMLLQEKNAVGRFAGVRLQDITFEGIITSCLNLVAEQ